MIRLAVDGSALLGGLAVTWLIAGPLLTAWILARIEPGQRVPGCDHNPAYPCQHTRMRAGATQRVTDLPRPQPMPEPRTWRFGGTETVDSEVILSR